MRKYYFYGYKPKSNGLVPTKFWSVSSQDWISKEMKQAFNLRQVTAIEYYFTKTIDKLGLLDLYELQKTKNNR